MFSMCSRMGERIRIEGRQLAAVIYVWLRSLPRWVWGEEPGYARLKKQKRHDPSKEPDPKQLTSELIAQRLEELGWTVFYDQPENSFQGVGEGLSAAPGPDPATRPALPHQSPGAGQ